MKYIKRNRFRNKVSLYKERISLYTIIIAFLALVNNVMSKLSDLFKIEISDKLIYSVNTTLFIVGVIFGLAYLYFTSKESRISRSREELKELLDNKRELQKIIKNIFNSETIDDKKDFTIDELNLAIINWYKKSDETSFVKYLFILKENLQSIIDDIGFDDFSYLLLEKSESFGFLQLNNNKFKLEI